MRIPFIQTVYYLLDQPRNELAANPKLNRAVASTLPTQFSPTDLFSIRLK